MASTTALIELLNRFDTAQQQPLRSDDEVAAMLRTVLAPDLELTDNERAELYAFMLIEENEFGLREWGSYFGPREKRLRDDSFVPEITLSQITPDFVNYWECRVPQCLNPILQARYSGLVWELSKKNKKYKAGL